MSLSNFLFYYKLLTNNGYFILYFIVQRSQVNINIIQYFVVKNFLYMSAILGPASGDM